MRALWITVKLVFWVGLIALVTWLIFSGGTSEAEDNRPRKGSPERPYGPTVYGNGGDYQVVKVNVGEGGPPITCIVWDGVDRKGGISCDWSR